MSSLLALFAVVGGIVAPSAALDENLADYRRSQGYEIEPTEYYVAVNDCDYIGWKAVLVFDGRTTPLMSVIDCEHPKHSQYRRYNNLIADAPVEVLKKYANRVNWTEGVLILIPPRG